MESVSLQVDLAELALLGQAVMDLIVSPDGLLPDEVKRLDALEGKLKRLALTTAAGRACHVPS
jgi:hypothetical protein